MRGGARLAAACLAAGTVGLGPTAAWATTGPPPPASCFQVDANGNYPTCTLVHGSWVRGDGATTHSSTATDAALGGSLVLAMLIGWAALRAARSRRRDESITLPTQATTSIQLDDTIALTDALEPAD